MFPVFLDLSGRLTVVIGGGNVGRRKLVALLEGGARVRLVCLDTRPADVDSPKVEWRQEPYRRDHLDGAALVIAAATPEVNRQVVADARVRGIWVNAASEPTTGDCFIPAHFRRGPLVVAVGTGGVAPLLAHKIRAGLEGQFDAAYEAWLNLLAEWRPIVMKQFASEEGRRAALARLCAWEWLERLRHEDSATVRNAMREEVDALAVAARTPL
jgi:precorrin-2 dehydrogenase/sirohydrochlorin ferrochelatase